MLSCMCDSQEFKHIQEKETYLDQDSNCFCINVFVSVRRGDVVSAWCGIRPLVIDPNAKNTQSIARNHVIEVMDNKLVTIGGKYSEIDMGLNCLQFKLAVTSIHILLGGLSKLAHKL